MGFQVLFGSYTSLLDVITQEWIQQSHLMPQIVNNIFVTPVVTPCSRLWRPDL